MKPFVGSDIQIGLLLGAEEGVKFIGHNDPANCFTVGGSVAVQNGFAERRGRPLHQRNGNVSGQDTGATQLGLSDGGVFDHSDHARISQFKIGLSGSADR